ncbi:SPOR domain-containing protein [Vibrio cholerae]|uniref:SPOR domain-containing protein n=1 Tax=Vibrio cholerae TaxID=666 RepID=UPI001A1FAC62|nr:SPOR domain-containing protein [Vibrio cholerae]EGR4294723.1 SPOR domain-containing protein [Vibrio cholerae]EGR4298538.1 SPOR domain-containing protein [Vibrio cholerae]MDA5317390.1 SPOR domain-containing protein [Vibrio cholerae]HAS3558281.1 SPOR domain-containing protein [Vibrio cholerae]HAS3587853.1 SPOR domain-containing protein [Vibrio cholerae]
MASKFQSRLVGTIVLVAIGVIVLPDVLDGKKTHFKEEIASVPIKPQPEGEVEKFEVLDPVQDDIALPEAPVSVTQTGQDNQASVALVTPTVVKNSSPVKVAAEQPVPVTVTEVPETNEYQDSAWIIQLVALKNADNARNLVADLQKRGYQAHVKQENDFTRVIIGPDVSKSKLETQLVELEKITGAKGQLLKFKPLNP